MVGQPAVCGRMVFVCREKIQKDKSTANILGAAGPLCGLGLGLGGLEGVAYGDPLPGEPEGSRGRRNT